MDKCNVNAGYKMAAYVKEWGFLNITVWCNCTKGESNWRKERLQVISKEFEQLNESQKQEYFSEYKKAVSRDND